MSHGYSNQRRVLQQDTSSGRSWGPPGRQSNNHFNTTPSVTSSRVGGSLFYSVPTMEDNDEDRHDQDDDDGHIHIHDSYMPDYESDDASSDASSNHSPPMSLFLDRPDTEREEPALTPAAIYLDVPPPISGKGKAAGSLGEQLLEPSAIPSGPTGWTSISYKRNFKDPFFAVLYLAALTAYFILGIVLLFTTSSSRLEDQIYNVYSVIKSSAGMLTLIVLLSTAMGTLWFLTLRSFARPVVWTTVLAVPCLAIIAFIWSLVSSFNGPMRQDGGRDPQDTGLTVLSFLPLSVGSLFLSVIYLRRQHIARTTAIIELACEILKDNPDMFFVSFGLMLIHVVFTAIWLVFFARGFLIGHVDSSAGGSWVLEGNFYPIAAYLIFIYMWTSAVLSNIQRVTLANVVSKWYFHRHEPFAYHSSKTTEPALINATTTSFGSVCLGALFIAIVQFSVFVLSRTAKKLKDNSFPLFVFIATCCRVIQGLVENFNNYTLIYVGITGESLFAAARSASKIFHRNILWGLITDFLTKLVLFINATMLSLLTGFAAYIFATHTLKSPYGYVIGILSSIIPFYITRFFTHIMAITVDATFLCYAIDLDTNTCHSNKAHSAFGGSY
ncbi:hypothetical protein BG006_001485 [Podila minutissima]|uniref:Protein PNS1 n=1 Tax=Podila minutissima TaxID=64525 RepID=A0A9P5SE07_9FUNG|nr:hypothetical protein BG006_001485 [Podila minutissima]